MIEKVPRIPHAAATVSEMASISRAAIDRSLNMGLWTPREDARKSLRICLISPYICGNSNVSGLLCRPLRTVAQDRLADVLIVGVAGLDLLGDGMHVAEAPFERVG